MIDMAEADTHANLMEGENEYRFNLIELTFATGYIRETKNGNFVKYSQDGYISSLVLFIILLAFGITLSSGRWITAEKPFPVSSTLVEGGLSIYMFIGFCFIVLMMFKSIRKKVSTEEQEVSLAKMQDNKHHMLKKALPLISFNVFLLGVITIDVMSICSFASCLPEYRHLGNLPNVEADIEDEVIVTMLYHIVRCIFCIFMSMFCCFCVYDNVVFYRRWYLRFGIIVLLSSLLWIWFESQVTESKNIFHHTEEEKPYCQNVTANGVHVNRTVLCVCKKTTSFEMYEDSSKYLCPLVTEYCLIVAECILDIFFHMKDSEGSGSNKG